MMGSSTIIELGSLSHKEYNQIVEYLSKYSSFIQPVNLERSSFQPIRIVEVERAEGNPPNYNNVKILFKTDEKDERAKSAISEAWKGLVDIILSDSK